MKSLYWMGAVAGLLLALAGVFFFIRRYLYALVDKRIAVYQKDLVARHIEEVQNMYRQMRGWRHDYHNHIQAMKALRALGQDSSLDDYLDSLDEDLSKVDTVIKTGNVMADAILNSKLSLAASKKIAVDASARVPQNLTVAEVDLCVIIGNLLDNAIEANEGLEQNALRFIRVYIDAKGEQLYLSITNTARERPKRAGERYISSKTGPNHGFGLLRADRLVNKYEGYMKCRDEEGAFTTEILLPL